MTLEWLSERKPVPVFVESFGVPSQPAETPVFLFGTRYDLSEVLCEGETLGDGEGYFVEYFEVEESPAGGWLLHRLLQRASVTYSEEDDPDDSLPAREVGASSRSVDAPPRWKSSEAEWPTYAGAPMKFLDQVELPETEVTRTLLTWNTNVFLFWTTRTAPITSRSPSSALTSRPPKSTTPTKTRVSDPSYASQPIPTPPAADGRDPAYDMLSVRIQGKKYRISNETLDRLVGPESWGRMDSGLLQNRIRDEYLAGRLIETQGQRLRLASPSEEAASRLRSEEDPGEILRWGLLHIAAQVTEVADQLRALGDAAEFDSDAATARLSRDTAPDRLPAEDHANVPDADDSR